MYILNLYKVLTVNIIEGHGESTVLAMVAGNTWFLGSDTWGWYRLFWMKPSKSVKRLSLSNWRKQLWCFWAHATLKLRGIDPPARQLCPKRFCLPWQKGFSLVFNHAKVTKKLNAPREANSLHVCCLVHWNGLSAQDSKQEVIKDVSKFLCKYSKKKRTTKCTHSY